MIDRSFCARIVRVYLSDQESFVFTVNGSFVSTLRRIRLAWRSYGRGPFVCAAVVLSAAGAARFLARIPNVRRAPEGTVRPVTAASKQNAARALAGLNWVFEPNVGQSDSRVKFLARAHDASVFLTNSSVYVSWARESHQSPRNAGSQDFVKLEFAGAGHRTRLVGDSQLPGKTNYLFGRNASHWHENVPHYAGVRYGGLYPGVDARFYGGAQGFEYDLTVAPGSDPREILLRVANADELQLDAEGNLLMRADARQLTMRRPEIYQLLHGARKNIRGGYRLRSDNSVGFEVGPYRHDLPLVIDPSISITYTTFLGGAGAEKGNSVAVDPSGKIYVGGTTTLATFPESTTLTDGPASGSYSLFVAKIDPSQTGASSLLYLTFIGGSGSDQGGMVALDNSVSPPNLAILGWTTSTDFPTTLGSLPAGPVNLTISKLNGLGNALIYSEYYGGSGSEATQGTGSIVVNSTGGAIATDPAGDVFVTSDTTSTDLPQPTTPNGFQQLFEGTGTAPTAPNNDGFLAEFGPSGSLAYATYFGVTATVGSSGVAVDGSGNAYVAGFTSSPTNFPFVNAFQSTYGGGNFDAFVMEINPGAGPAGLLYSSLLGGSGSDQALSIAVDTQTPPDAYVSGTTQSPNLIPATGVTNSAYQSSLNGTSNGFLAVISQSTNSQSANVPALQYISYLGGSGTDAAQSVAVFSPAQVYVAGNATSSNFPALCSLQGFSGSQDAFLAEFNPSVGGTSSLLYTTFLGGSATTEGNSVGSDASGNAFVFGDTLSPDYPLAQHPQNGFQLTCTSCTATPAAADALLTEVNLTAGPVACAMFSPSPVNVGSFADGTTSPAVNLTMTNDGTANLDISSITITGANQGDFSQTNACLANSPIAPGGNCSISITFTPTAVGPETATLQMTDDGVGSPQMLTLNGTGTAVGVSLSGTSLAFPNTAQGEVSSTESITLTNTSPDTVAVQTASIQGTNSKDFEYGVQNNCTSSIAAGGTCTIAVQFVPSEPNPPASGIALSAQDVLVLMDTVNQSSQTITIPLTGTEIPVAPMIVLAPASLNFGSENVGGTTAPQQITLTNNGSAALSISGISITGANPGDFAQTNTCPASLAANGNCTISITFQPTATGNRSASLSVSDNQNPSPQTVPLSGMGTAAGVNFMPSSLTFAGQDPGAPPSAAQTVTLKNTGNGPLTISSITVTGADAADFLPPGQSAPQKNCPIAPNTLSAGNSCPIQVTFAPTAVGNRSASLAVADNANPSPQLVSLSGTGTAPVAQINPVSIQFNTPTVVGASSSQTVEVENTGNGPLVITSIGFTGADSGDFQVYGACVGANGASVTVAVESNCSLTVVFVPTAPGSLSAMLSVTDNAKPSPQLIPVSGDATNFKLAAITGGSTSVTVAAGETATFNMQITPMNSFAGTVALSCSNLTPASSCTVGPSNVNVSGTSAAGFTVTVTTTAPPASAYFVPFTTGSPRPRVKGVTSLGLLFCVLMLLSLRKRQKRPRRLRPAWLLAGVLLLVSCGGGSSNPSGSGTPAGTYSLTVSGTVPGLTSAKAKTVTLTVTVQ